MCLNDILFFFYYAVYRSINATATIPYTGGNQFISLYNNRIVFFPDRVTTWAECEDRRSFDLVSSVVFGEKGRVDVDRSGLAQGLRTARGTFTNFQERGRQSELFT